MQCPLCSTPLAAETVTCPVCGTNLEVVLTLQSLRLEMQRAQEQAVDMATRLRAFQEGLERLDATVRSTFATQRLPPTSVEDADQTGADLPRVAAAAPEELPELAAAPESGFASGLTDGAELRFGQKWLLMVGVASTVLGIGFFLKYAFEQDWVGPSGRLALGYLAAGGFLWSGEALRRRLAATFGLCLSGGGLATLYLTTFAAFQLYRLIGEALAFSLMVLVTVVACLLALVYNTQWLAVLGLVGGFLTPVILSTGQAAQVTLMSYMVLLNSGILSLAAWKRWQILNTSGFLCTWLLFSGWFVSSYTSTLFWRTFVFLQIFFVIYTCMPFMYYFLHASRAPLRGLALTSLNTTIAFAYTYGMVRAYTTLPVVSVVTLVYAGLFFGLAAFLVRRQPDNLEPFVLLLAKGLIFLILTVPLLFSGHWITLFWAVQAGVILWAGLRLSRHWLCYGALALLLLAVGKWLTYDYAVVFGLRPDALYYATGFSALLLERWGTTAVVLGMLFGSAHLLRTAERVLGETQTSLVVVLYGLCTALLFLALTIEVSAFCYERAPQARFAAISVLWTLYSVSLMLMGFWQQQAMLRLVSLGLFGITVLKVFFADMAHVSTPFRIISFVVLGLMLIGASSLYYRYRGVLLPSSPPEERS